MKATVRDTTVLRSLSPLEMAAYLRGHGWKQTGKLGDNAIIWTLPAPEGGEYEILLPLQTSFSDYARRTAEILQTLEVAEARSQLEILRDIQSATSDVIRIRVKQSLTEEGTLPFEYGIQVLQGLKALMLATACAASQPLALYPSRKPRRALRYIEGLRLGQTEEEGYILTLHSPVPPRLRTNGVLPEEGFLEEPFERRVTLTLAGALAAVQNAVIQAEGTGDLKPFEEAVPAGVSVNLCEALIEMGSEGLTQEIMLQISWSPTRAVSDKTPTRFHFQGDAIPVLREAARLLRETERRSRNRPASPTNTRREQKITS
jgi:hypothetical protein